MLYAGNKKGQIDYMYSVRKKMAKNKMDYWLLLQFQQFFYHTPLIISSWIGVQNNASGRT
jgi:hypothetical protein